VTFTLVTPGTHDPSTGTWSAPTSTAMTGAAIQIADDGKMYAALGLTVIQAVTLLFAPDTEGDMPSLDAQVLWGADLYTVKAVKPLRPNGTAILSRVVVSR
jgi:hypothetical protein